MLYDSINYIRFSIERNLSYLLIKLMFWTLAYVSINGRTRLHDSDSDKYPNGNANFSPSHTLALHSHATRMKMNHIHSSYTKAFSPVMIVRYSIHYNKILSLPYFW